MQGILERVLQTIRRHSLLPPSARVLVAVSGGSDSVALAHLLHRLSKTEEFKVSGIIHLHHGLRGEAADEDAKATRVLADDLQVPYHETRVDVRAMARERGNSIEEAGRAARIAFFEETAKRVGADRVAVGHHQDDQALDLSAYTSRRLLSGPSPNRADSFHFPEDVPEVLNPVRFLNYTHQHHVTVRV